MTNERHDDEVVSARYREIANETTPAHLDDKIMRMAANKAQHPQYSRSMSWTRPLAWAATIALCLAITLEVSRGPVPEPIVSTPATGERANEATDLFEAEAPAMAVPADKPDLGDSLHKQTADEPGRAARERREMDLVESDDAATPPASAPLEFEVKDADVMQQVEDLARSKNTTNQEPLAEEISIRASSALRVPGHCPDEARVDPESWLACIEALKEAGDVEAALHEEESLIEVFPDFKMP